MPPDVVGHPQEWHHIVGDFGEMSTFVWAIRLGGGVEDNEMVTMERSDGPGRWSTSDRRELPWRPE